MTFGHFREPNSALIVLEKLEVCTTVVLWCGMVWNSTEIPPRPRGMVWNIPWHVCLSVCPCGDRQTVVVGGMRWWFGGGGAVDDD
jgi:hypothetical protein